MTNELIINEEIRIEDMIYEVRGKQVMLDSDLAKLYQCSNGTKSINLAVKRHINRFPERFMFRLTKEEVLNSRFQFETLKEITRGKNIKYLPYVFTEQGVAMLATVLRTNVAEEVSINIMDAFVSMKKYISSNLLEQRYFNNLTIKNSEDIKLLTESFDKLSNKELKSEIYFEGQIYDAYSKIIDIMSKAKMSIIVIDNYADKSVLDMISRMKVRVLLITRKNSLLREQDLEKYNKQYTNLEVIYNNTFHDRFMILDDEILYHLGASFKDLGNKCFAITGINEKRILDELKCRLKM